MSAWPAVLRDGDVQVRPLRLRDAAAWTETRVRNQAWLEPWEGSPPAQPPMDWADRHSPSAYAAMLRVLRREARAGRCLPFAVWHRARLVGQVNVNSIVRGALDGGSLGYWVAERVAGRGVIPTAVALVVDHAFMTLGLHRVEAQVSPANPASLRVVAKLGFRREGLYERLLHIDGAWRDHLCHALLREDVPEGVLRRYLQA